MFLFRNIKKSQNWFNKFISFRNIFSFGLSYEVGTTENFTRCKAFFWFHFVMKCVLIVPEISDGFIHYSVFSIDSARQISGMYIELLLLRKKSRPASLFFYNDLHGTCKSFCRPEGSTWISSQNVLHIVISSRPVVSYMKHQQKITMRKNN